MTAISVPLGQVLALCRGRSCAYKRLSETVPKHCWFRTQGTQCHTEQEEDWSPPYPVHSVQTAGQYYRPKGATSGVPVEGSGMVGTGHRAQQSQKAMSRLSVVYIETGLP